MRLARRAGSGVRARLGGDRGSPKRPFVRGPESPARITDQGGARPHRSLSRRRARPGLAIVAWLAIAVALSGCAAASTSATGVVIALDSTGGQVSSFTLRTSGGTVIPFSIGTLETDGDAFPASHIAVHAATLGPITVDYREEGGRNVVYRMVDAP
jgi:hypothetical protein